MACELPANSRIYGIGRAQKAVSPPLFSKPKAPSQEEGKGSQMGPAFMSATEPASLVLFSAFPDHDTAGPSDTISLEQERS